MEARELYLRILGDDPSAYDEQSQRLGHGHGYVEKLIPGNRESRLSTAVEVASKSGYDIIVGDYILDVP